MPMPGPADVGPYLWGTRVRRADRQPTVRQRDADTWCVARPARQLKGRFGMTWAVAFGAPMDPARLAVHPLGTPTHQFDVDRIARELTSPTLPGEIPSRGVEL